MKFASLVAVLCVLCVSLTAPVMAEPRSLSGSFELQAVTPEVKNSLTFSGGLFYKITPQWGFKAFFLMKGPWAEAYVGPSWQPLPWLQLFVGAGASQNNGTLDLRLAYNLTMAHKGFCFNGSVEMNTPAFQGNYQSIWYDLNVTYQPLPWLVVGLKDRRPVGFGPMVRFKYDVLEVWIVWAPISAETKVIDLDRFMVGLKFNL